MRTLAIVTAILLPLPLASWAGDGDAGRGEAAFVSDCRRCHKDRTAIGMDVAKIPPEERVATLESFLAGHHTREADRRADLVAYLVTMAQ
ncbi:MAG: hypothetical protein KDE00_06500 [Rhodobacteraceae bacterium]|nr:hypothetical protein [Paracoccaceae bacterium]